MKYAPKIDLNDLNSCYTLCLNHIKDGSKVLDVGCASGIVGEILFNEKKCTIVGIDNSSEFIKIAESKNIYKELFLLDLNKIDNELEKYNKYFDYIYMGDVIEHLYNHKHFLTKMNLLTNKYLIFSIPNISHGSIKLSLLKNKFEYTPMGLLDETHIRFFTLDSIINTMTELNLEIVNLDRIYAAFESTDQKISFSEYPDSVLTYIDNDPESYVFQYVIKAKLNINKDDKDLQKSNKQFSKITDEELKKILPIKNKSKKRRNFLRILLSNIEKKIRKTYRKQS